MMKKSVLRHLRRLAGVTYFLVFFCILLTESALAYVDPATTAMLTQIVAGVFITLGVVFGVFRRKIMLFFRNLSVMRAKRKIEKQNKDV
jgi:uncharacterized membrane protein